MDIEAFTKGRSVEAQFDLVSSLNTIVKSVLESKSIEADNTILLPTGDGICIALLDAKQFDIHLGIGLEILERLADYNEQTDDEMRKFRIRIGINENIDNIVTDINGRQNVAGNGINMAQRIMNLADGNQILVGQSVNEILSGREKYMSRLRRYVGSAKHDSEFPVYQFVCADQKGLNSKVPGFAKPRVVEERKLSKLAAYYIAHAIVNKDFLLSHRDDFANERPGSIILYLKALDSKNESETTQFERLSPSAYGAPNASFDEQYAHYSKIEFWITTKLAGFIMDSVLEPFTQCFERSQFFPLWCFISLEGLRKLRDEWPEIWSGFSLNNDQP